MHIVHTRDDAARSGHSGKRSNRHGTRHKQPITRFRVRVNARCIKFIGAKRRNSARMRWADIDQIVACQRDLLTVDDVCLAFAAGDERQTVSEMDDGSWELVRAVHNRFPGIDPQWYQQVIRPPFAPNRHILWNRR